MFQVIRETMETELLEWVNSALGYAATPGVIIPVFLLLAMTIFYLVSVTRALRDANTQLRMQLEYERTEGRRKVYAMADAKREMEANKNKVLPEVPPKPKRNLSQAASSVMAVARMTKMISGEGKEPTKEAKSAHIPVAVVTGKRSLKGNNSAHKEPEKARSIESKFLVYKAANKVTKRMQNNSKTNRPLKSSASADHVGNVHRSMGCTKVTEEPHEGHIHVTSAYPIESEDDVDTSARPDSRRMSASVESRTVIANDVTEAAPASAKPNRPRIPPRVPPKPFAKKSRYNKPLSDMDSITSDEPNTFSSTLTGFDRDSDIVPEPTNTLKKANYFTSAIDVFERKSH